MERIAVMPIDDNPAFLRILIRFLRHRGAEEVIVVGSASSGIEGLARAAELRPQVVLLDLAMPDMPGWEVIPRLRAIHPRGTGSSS